MVRMWEIGLHLPHGRKNKDKGIPRIADLHSQKLKVAESHGKVKRSLAWLRWSSLISRNKEHISGPSSDGNPSQQSEERIISPGVLEVKRKVEKINNNLSSAGSTQTPNGSLGDELGGKMIGRRPAYSSSPIHDTVMTGPSGEVPGAVPTKRLSANSRDELRGSTKRTKKGDQGLGQLEPVLMHKEGSDKQLQSELDELKAELRNREDIGKSDKAKTAQYRQQWQTLQQTVKELSQQKLAMEQRVRDYGKKIEGFEAITKELQEENIHLKSALQGKEQMLAEYRNDIVKLSNARPDSKRDDHYFEQSFSILFRSIDAWVLQYYLTVNPNLEDPTALHPLMEEFFTTTAGQGLAILQHEPLFTTQAYVTAHIISRVLSPALFGLEDDSFERVYKTIEPSSDPEELTRWRMSTVHLISRREEFLNNISRKAEETATELVGSLAPLIEASKNVNYKPGPRTKKLKAIVEQAAKLAWEIGQEPSFMSFRVFEPSTKCDSSYVSDARGLRNDEELAAMGAVVRLTVHPVVIRKAYNRAEEIVIVKAKVLPLEPTDT